MSGCEPGLAQRSPFQGALGQVLSRDAYTSTTLAPNQVGTHLTGSVGRRENRQRTEGVTSGQARRGWQGKSLLELPEERATPIKLKDEKLRETRAPGKSESSLGGSRSPWKPATWADLTAVSGPVQTCRLSSEAAGRAVNSSAGRRSTRMTALHPEVRLLGCKGHQPGLRSNSREK